MGTGIILLAALTLQPPAGWQDAAAGVLLGGSANRSDTSPVSTQPLAANEVLLEVGALGVHAVPGGSRDAARQHYRPRQHR